MIEQLNHLISQDRKAVYLLLRQYASTDKSFILNSDLVKEFDNFCQTPAGRNLRGSTFENLIRHTQVAVVDVPPVAVAPSVELVHGARHVPGPVRHDDLGPFAAGDGLDLLELQGLWDSILRGALDVGVDLVSRWELEQRGFPRGYQRGRTRRRSRWM